MDTRKATADLTSLRYDQKYTKSSNSSHLQQQNWPTFTPQPQPLRTKIPRHVDIQCPRRYLLEMTTEKCLRYFTRPSQPVDLQVSQTRERTEAKIQQTLHLYLSLRVWQITNPDALLQANVAQYIKHSQKRGIVAFGATTRWHIPLMRQIWQRKGERFLCFPG